MAKQTTTKQTTTKQTTTKPVTFKGLTSKQIGVVIRDGYGNQIKEILGGSDEKVARFNQIATTVVSNNPKLKDCTQASVVGSILQTSILFLNPSPALGICAFIPQMNSMIKAWECQFQIQYQGWILLACRSGKVLDVYTEIRYEKDRFSLHLGSKPEIIHEPYLDGDRGKMLGAYAVWILKDAPYPHLEYMTAGDIAKVKKVSRSAGSEYSPWIKWPEAMWRKSVLKRSRKYIPFSVEESTVLASDEQVLKPESFSPMTGSVKEETMEREPDAIYENQAEGQADAEEKKAQSAVSERLEYNMFKEEWTAAADDELNKMIVEKAKKKLDETFKSFCDYKNCAAKTYISMGKVMRVEFLYFVLHPEVFKDKKGAAEK